MPQPFEGMKDILLSYDTDIAFENGDLMTTTGIDYIEREIYKILITEPGDWKASPLIGSSPNAFTGEQNTRETAERIKNFILEGITRTVYPATADVRIIPTNYDRVLVFIDVFIPNYETVTIPFEFNFISGFKKMNKRDERVIPSKSNKNYKINDISKMSRPNKYWSRIRQTS